MYKKAKVIKTGPCFKDKTTVYLLNKVYSIYFKLYNSMKEISKNLDYLRKRYERTTHLYNNRIFEAEISFFAI